MKAVILAAGKGNRLLPLTHDIPKPLINIAGINIIDRIFVSLPDQIDEVIIVVEHLQEKIKIYVGDSFYGRKVKYVDQVKMRGTFGAVLSAKDFFDIDERFLVLNGDDIHDKIELELYLLKQRTFGLQRMIMPGYHSIQIDKNGLVKEFKPQTESEKNNGAMIATGAYVVDGNIFKSSGILLIDGEYGLPQTILSQKDDYPIHAVITKKWIPINSFSDIEKAENLLTNDK